MKLVFLVQKNAWFVEDKQSWYRINDRQDIALAMSGLSLSMVNQHDLVEQPHQAGCAHVTQSDESKLLIELLSPDNERIDTVEVSLGMNTLCNVEWKTKQFRDGWVATDSTLMLDNVGTMYLDAYLPPQPGSDGKALHIANDQTGKVHKIWMRRDHKTRIALLEKGNEAKVTLKLSCDPEQVDQTTDPRQLGFVLIAEEVHPA